MPEVPHRPTPGCEKAREIEQCSNEAHGIQIILSFFFVYVFGAQFSLNKNCKKVAKNRKAIQGYMRENLKRV